MRAYVWARGGFTRKSGRFSSTLPVFRAVVPYFIGDEGRVVYSVPNCRTVAVLHDFH